MAPQARQACGDALDILRRVLRQRGQHDVLARLQIGQSRHPARSISRPAIGWPGTNWAIALAQRGARGRDHVGLGAAGVGDDGAGLQMRARSLPGWRRSARPARPAAPGRRRAWRLPAESQTSSMMPSSQRALQRARRRPMPTTCAAAPACFNASANEPPIRPTPKMTIFRNTGAATACCVADHSASAFFSAAMNAAFSSRQADRDAQPLRQAVVADRAHDHALLEQRQVDARAGAVVVAARTSTKLPYDGTYSRPSSSNACGQLRIACGIVLRALLQERLVVQRGDRRGLRQRVDVERLADAVQQVGQGRLRDRKADAQAGQAVGLREGARDEQVRDNVRTQATESYCCSGARYSL